LSTAETYRDAAREHLLRAQKMYEQDEFFLAHYLFGLSVESHLRAYLRRRSDEFDPRHDLERLARASGFYDIVASGQADTFSEAFAILNQRWRANHRYYSERQFLDYMTEIKAEFGQRGDRWKNICRRTLNLAYTVINQGEAKWDSLP